MPLLLKSHADGCCLCSGRLEEGVRGAVHKLRVPHAKGVGREQTSGFMQGSSPRSPWESTLGTAIWMSGLQFSFLDGFVRLLDRDLPQRGTGVNSVVFFMLRGALWIHS